MTIIFLSRPHPHRSPLPILDLFAYAFGIFGQMLKLYLNLLNKY